MRSSIFVVSVMLAVTAIAQPSVGPGANRYATDCYPGFDSEDEIVKPSKKEPKLFGWFWHRSPHEETAAEQFAYCARLEVDREWSDACREYDLLVRQWPTAPEAPKAQRRLADILLEQEQLTDEALAEYRYLVDFYSSDCDYREVAETMFRACELFRQEGKTFCFMRFANTVDVRRAYEALVLRAPGEPFVPGAMLTIAELRVDEGKLEQAVEVYGNLRNLYPATVEARTAFHGEAKVRMMLIDEHGYNRDRVRDTIAFLRQAMAVDRAGQYAEDYGKWLAQATTMLDDEAWGAAKFYDSKTRTRHSAINAYRNFIENHPSSTHVGEAKARLAELEGEGK